MKLFIYSIFDQAVRSYNQPFFMPADGAAIRLFQNQIGNKDSLLSQHPDQFTLFKIGEFDDKDGSFSTFPPTSLGNGKQYADKTSVPVYTTLEVVRMLEVMQSKHEEILAVIESNCGRI